MRQLETGVGARYENKCQARWQQRAGVRRVGVSIELATLHCIPLALGQGTRTVLTSDMVDDLDAPILLWPLGELAGAVRYWYQFPRERSLRALVVQAINHQDAALHVAGVKHTKRIVRRGVLWRVSITKQLGLWTIVYCGAME